MFSSSVHQLKWSLTGVIVLPAPKQCKGKSFKSTIHLHSLISPKMNHLMIWWSLTIPQPQPPRPTATRPPRPSRDRSVRRGGPSRRGGDPDLQVNIPGCWVPFMTPIQFSRLFWCSIVGAWDGFLRAICEFPKNPSVDGSEIWRAPVDMLNIHHYLQGFSTIPGGARFLPSTVFLNIYQGSLYEITNPPKKIQYEKNWNSWKWPATCASHLILPKWVPFNDPCFGGWKWNQSSSRNALN